MSEFWFAFTLGFSTACAGGAVLWQLWTGDMDETPAEREAAEQRIRDLAPLSEGWGQPLNWPRRPR